MTSHIFDLLLRSLAPFVTQVLVPSHQRKPNFNERTVFSRTTTRPLASLPASTHRKFRYGSILLMKLPPYGAPNSFPVAAGRPLIYIDRLIRCAQLCGYSVILLCQSSQLSHSRRSVSLHPWYTTQRPQSLPVIRAIVISRLSLHTAQIIRHVYPSATRRRHGLPQRQTHTDVPITDCPLVSLD